LGSQLIFTQAFDSLPQSTKGPEKDKHSIFFRASFLDVSCWLFSFLGSLPNLLNTILATCRKRFRNAINIVMVCQGNRPKTKQSSFGNQLGGSQDAIGGGSKWSAVMQTATAPVSSVTALKTGKQNMTS
jgi:hypothetical protein